MTLRRGRRPGLREAGPQLIPSLSDPDTPMCRKAPVLQRQRETERGEPREGESNPPEACCDPPSLRYCPPHWKHLKKAVASRAGSRTCLGNAAGLSGLRTFWILQVREPHLIYPRSLCLVFPWVQLQGMLPVRSRRAPRGALPGCSILSATWALSHQPGTRQPSDGTQAELSHLCRLPGLSPSPLSMPFCSPRIRATRTTGYLTFSNDLVCGFKVK